MDSEASWALLALAAALVLGLTGLVAWLAVTEVRAVRPAPAGRRGAGGDEVPGSRQADL